MPPHTRLDDVAAAAPRRDATPLDHAPVPGAHLVAGGLEVAVHAPFATAVTLCLFGPSGDPAQERQVRLVQRRRGWWSGRVDGVGAGERYGYRVDGPWEPEAGHRHNPAKVLLDPYARMVDRVLDAYPPALFGHVVGDDGRADIAVRSDLDSAGVAPLGVVVDERFDWGEHPRPRRELADSVVYEVHVREMTATMPGVPEHLRGTYAGMAHPACVEHLLSLGVTAVELLPVHHFVSEPEVLARGLVNHWGYNTLGFFAPHLPYASTTDPQGALDELKGMVKMLHAAGIEVILDVVYNHTAEQSVQGATLSWRGLAGRTSYRLDERGRDVDVTGCGNTLDLRDATTQRMVLDSLRYWVTQCGVDGFRFDLAVALARGTHDDYDPGHPFLTALRTDPVLSGVHLIAEPWDVGPHGWRTGQMPPPLAEWNDRYRDAAREFWLSDLAVARGARQGSSTHGVREIATRLAGSRDLFGSGERGPASSIGFVTAHDGFTLADLTAYDVKHNEANGEDGRDGSDHNRSWNHGVEGPTDDAEVLALRRRSRRNLLATLLLSTGVPMIAAGDEIGRTTQGNNNPYCQDGPLTWLDWELGAEQEDLLATTRALSGWRHELATLRHRRHYTGSPLDDHGASDIGWYDEHGSAMTHQWGESSRRVLQMHLDGAPLGHRSALVVLHGAGHDGRVVLPAPPGVAGFELWWDSAWERPDEGERVHVPAGEGVDVTAASIRLYVATPA
ncbi:glycogen debranching protein GlgX [Janibacter melonis]|uniref:Glycogen debranching protein GlgX n=1 Tax=Janibacter melonis TaxID=262209 RepID=A0A650GDZ0_9MICO|nr:glycogen debranching protein GlgX [Janibacter melonis]QGX08446.1 glycogen debranching protein GlgX [Janibacter melonis]